MPLTDFQLELGRLLSGNRSEDSYLAGAAALLAEPNTRRYSRDLDYFQDSTARVASAYEADVSTLSGRGYSVELLVAQPGFVRAVVKRGGGATKIEWAQDSSWRFMPVIRSELFGYQLHPIDLATNKILALAGRDEPRDLLDTLHLHDHLLALGPLIWAAVGKDPGFSPLSLLELLRRRGRVRPEELARLDLTAPVDIHELKADWLEAMESAEGFVRTRPPEEAGCLYYAVEHDRFVDPNGPDMSKIEPHYGRPGGVLPRIQEE